jgi:PPOX class probable F420-dependent enzyme
MARKDITMNPDEIREFLTTGHTLQVATVGKDGSPHLAPMWFVMDGDSVVFRSFTKSQKIVNLQRDPRLTVLHERGLAYAELQGVMIRGTGNLITDPGYVLETYRLLAAKYPMVGPEPVDLDDEALEAAFGRFAPKNTAVVVEADKIVTWDHTKLGGAY